MRYYLGQTEYKWSHAESDLEKIWIRKELGDELYRTVESNNWKWKLLRTHSTVLPGDVYCRCDVYVESHDDKLDTHFLLKFPTARPVEPTKREAPALPPQAAKR